MHGKSLSIATDHNTVQNESKLNGLVTRIELTSDFNDSILYFQRNFTINFRVFLCLVTCFLGVTGSLLCRFQLYQRKNVLIYYYFIGEEQRNCSTLCRHSNETMTLRKWMVEFLRVFENRGIKIAPVTRFASPNESNYFNFVRCWRPVVMLTFLF